MQTDATHEPSVVSARVEADLGRLADVSDPRSLTFYVAFIRALEEAKSRRRGRATSIRYRCPFEGPGHHQRQVLHSKDRKRRQDLVDKRNKQLSEKIRNVKGVLDFSRIKAPRHCHTAIIRKREDKERRRENAKIRRALLAEQDQRVETGELRRQRSRLSTRRCEEERRYMMTTLP